MKRLLLGPLQLMLPVILFAQDSPMTATQGERILEELKQIRQLLEAQSAAARRPPVPTKLSLETKGRQTLGAPDAPLTMFEFTDYQCPACRRFHLEIFPLLKRDFIDTGKVRFVAWDLPLTEIHPEALPAAWAARCAGDQGKFWQYRDKAQTAVVPTDKDVLIQFAEELQLAIPAFKKCQESDGYSRIIEQEREAALAMGVEATPSFVIGKSTASGVDGDLIIGSMPYPLLSARLKALIENIVVSNK